MERDVSQDEALPRRPARPEPPGPLRRTVSPGTATSERSSPGDPRY
jgi:hypothetical protein